MSKKKKKRRPPVRPGGAAAEVPSTEEQSDAAVGSNGEQRPGPLRSSSRRRGSGSSASRAQDRRGRRPADGAARAGPGPQEPQPPILVPLARSLVLVATSAPILVATFLSVLVMWLLYSSSGIIRVASPGTMAQIQSLVPLHSLLDLQFMFASLRVFPSPLAIGLGALLLLLRAAFVSLQISLVLEALENPSASWREQVRYAGRRAFSVMQFVFAIEAGMVVAVYALSSILGTFFGLLGLVLAVMIEMYLLVLSPIVAGAERLGAAAAVRLSVRAARLRGPQHMTLAFVYVFATLTLVLRLRTGASAESTPSLEIWAYVLLASFVHVSVMAALTYRWLLVRDVVGADQERERAVAARPGRARSS